MLLVCLLHWWDWQTSQHTTDWTQTGDEKWWCQQSHCWTPFTHEAQNWLGLCWMRYLQYGLLQTTHSRKLVESQQPIKSWLNWPMSATIKRVYTISWRSTIHMTLKMTSAQVVERSVNVNNSSFQNCTNPDNHTQQTTEIFVLDTSNLKIWQRQYTSGSWKYRSISFPWSRVIRRRKNKIRVQ